MYLTFDQVILVSDKSKVRAGDPVVYEREYRGNRVLTTENQDSQYTGPAKRYGRIYEDTSGNVCIVPDVWSEDDAMLAKDWR